MKEVEILVQVFDKKKKILESLKNFNFKGIKKTKDLYFFDPLRSNFQVKNNAYPREWFRIRLKNNKSYITYKEDIFDKRNIWLHSNEYESEVKDFNILKQIIGKLGYNELVEIDNIKHVYETEDYEIVFEEVKNLGFFLEVEKLNVNDKDNVRKIKEKIQEFIDNLDLHVSSELNMGKPELMLKSKL